MYYGRPCVERGTFDPRALLQFNGWRLLEANIFATEDYFQTTIYIGGYTPHPVHVQVAVSSTDRHFKKHKGFGILWFTVDLNTGSTFLDNVQRDLVVRLQEFRDLLTVLAMPLHAQMERFQTEIEVKRILRSAAARLPARRRERRQSAASTHLLWSWNKASTETVLPVFSILL